MSTWRLVCRRIGPEVGRRAWAQYCIERCIGVAQFSSQSTQGKDDKEEADLEGGLTDWIPPNRPLPGDKGQSHHVVQIEDEEPHWFNSEREEEEMELEKIERALQQQQMQQQQQQQQQDASADDTGTGSVDWLQTRRKKGIAMMTPDAAEAKRQEDSDLPVIPLTLLSEKEIVSCLTYMGGYDFNTILDGPEKRMGGAEGMIFVTGSSVHHVDTMTNMLQRQLKKRDLAKVGVVGAMLGAEGSDNDGWRVVDCRNYIVHIQTETMRKQLNMESIWSGNDKMLNVNLYDEDDVEDYVAANPVPDNMGVSTRELDHTLSHLKKWNLKHKSVVSRPRRKNKKRTKLGFR